MGKIHCRGGPSHPQRPFPTGNTIQKLLSACLQIISKHPSSSSPTAPPPCKDMLPTCNCLRAPRTSTRRTGVPDTGLPTQGPLCVLPGSQGGPRQTHM